MKKGERRKKRQARRDLRRQNWKELRKMVGTVGTPKTGDKVIDKFNEYWPFFRKSLEFVRDLKITRQKPDEKIDAIIALGDKRAAGNATKSDVTAFESKMQKTWKVIRFILNAITVFTDARRDEVIDKIIDTGNWITGLQDKEEDLLGEIAGG